MSDGTERIDGSQGTARMDAGTARMDAGTARMDASQSASPAGVGTIFADGQTIVLNGKNCLIEKLVSMGSGEALVYKIQIDEKPYALKHYKPNTPLSDTAKKVLTKIMDNPQDRIVRIFGFGKLNDQDYEIMEYAEGGTLEHYLKKSGGIKDINKIKSVVKQINEGIQQLHGFYKIIYQDVKPENIYFRDSARLSLVLADFGISSVMQDGSEEVEVTASVTDLYGAPELARKGNNTKVIVTPAVDYFALGITLYELWLGEQPFKEIKATTRERRIQNKDVNFPLDMPGDCKTLIQGLLDPLPKDRYGNEHIQKWLKGEALTLDNSKPVTSTVYKPLKFGSEFASNPKEMAALMGKYPDAGKVCLYDEFITSNLKEAGDVTLYTEIKNVISQYANDQQAGLTAAIYTLDPETPFISRAGKTCKSSEDIADAIMADSAHYMDDLKNPNASLYIYIAVTGGSQGKEVAQDFYNYFKEYSPQRALTLVYLKLQSDGGITLGSKRYLSTDELAQEKDGAQIELIKKAVREKDSPLLVWLSDEYGDYFKSTEEFIKLSIPDQFFLLGLLPSLSYKELTGSNGETALKDLIDKYPWRSDLFEAYAAHGLPLKGLILDSPIKRTPIDYVVCNFNELSKVRNSDIILPLGLGSGSRSGSGSGGRGYGISLIKPASTPAPIAQPSQSSHADTVPNLLRLLCKLGADINECSSDGTDPLQNAYEANNDNLIKLLLEMGADKGKYDEIVKQRANKERKEQEHRTEQEQQKQEHIQQKQEQLKELRQQLKYNGCISANTSYTVGLKANGTVVSVGNDAYCNTDIGQCETSSWKNIVAVSAGDFHTVGLRSNGTVIAVGNNDDGACNTGSWHDIVAIAVGSLYTVGLKADGTVVAVGYNKDNQCNTGDWRDIVAVAAGCHTVGLKADGTVVAVGDNHNGSCNTKDWNDIVAVAAGAQYTVGLKADGTVVAVGYNKDNQCNTSNWRDIIAVAAGGRHTVGLKADGTVVVVGNNENGSCNTGEWHDIVAVSAGYMYTVGLKADGTVVAVGNNDEGQCNIGDWRDIGPVDKKQLEQRIEQSNNWALQGLCPHCGGQLGGLFTKKCKDCGKEQ